MKGWNDPPAQSLQAAKRSPDNPFRRQAVNSSTAHKRSYSSGAFQPGGDALFHAPPGGCFTPPVISNSPSQIPSILVPSNEQNAAPTAFPAYLPGNLATRSWSNFENPGLSSSSSCEGLNPNAQGSGISPRLHNQMSAPEGNQNELANALQLKLQNLQQPLFPTGFQRVSPLASPAISSPTRKLNSSSPTNAALIEAIVPSFEVQQTLEKVDLLGQRFGETTIETNQVEKLMLKLKILKTEWSDYSEELRSLVHKMVFCVCTNQTDLAMRCFIKLSVDYSKQTMMWSVAFKKLIRHFETNNL